MAERTESIIIQVAPGYENIKIREMQLFGWNLHGCQEVNRRGDAYGGPSFLTKLGLENKYVIKTTVWRYVKMHFTRSLSLPNLDQIKRIEAEYVLLPIFQDKFLVFQS